jgi:DNA-binding HxlR family transcriptional regulator
LVEFGLLTRKSYEIPPRVECALAQKGRVLGRMFDGMRFWATKYRFPDGADGKADARSKRKTGRCRRFPWGK